MLGFRMLLFRLFVLNFGVLLCSSEQFITPCKKKDWDCMTRTAKSVLPAVAAGIPSLGVPSSDPLYHTEIVGDLSTLKYKFINTTVTGFKNCDIDNVKLDLVKLNFELTCPDLILVGQYEISGQLIILPVEGNGDYQIHAKKYNIKVDTDLKYNEGSDGKNHLTIKKYTTVAEPVEAVVFDMKNLFNGQKDLADNVLKFANENWKEVTAFVQDPVIGVNVKKIIANINKLLKKIPIEELVSE